MNLGQSVLLYIGIGVIVMALFCLLTYWFNKRLQQALDDQNQVYSMIQQIRGKEESEDDGQYQNFTDLRKKNEQKKGKKGEQLFEIEMTQIKQPLKGYGNSVYGMGRLRKRLEGEPLKKTQQTSRQLPSSRSFKTQSKRGKGNFSNRSQSTIEDQNDADNKKSPKMRKTQKIFFHKFINKIVEYSEKGVNIVQNDVKSITKLQKVEEKRHIKKIEIKPEHASFNDTLQAYGFEKGQYCAYKFQTTIEIPNMKDGEEYPISSLKTTEAKEQIQFVEYYCIKDQLQQGL